MVAVRGQMIQAAVDMVIETCCNCGVLFAMTKDFKDEKLKYRNSPNRRTFFCPNGHQQFYLGETEEQKLKKEVQRLEREVESETRAKRRAQESATHERNRANGYKGHATRITKRVKHGVCICCNRTFQDLARHMATKHPQLTPQDSVEEPFILSEANNG